LQKIGKPAACIERSESQGRVRIRGIAATICPILVVSPLPSPGRRSLMLMLRRTTFDFLISFREFLACPRMREYLSHFDNNG